MTSNEELQQQLDALRAEMHQLRAQLAAPAPAEAPYRVLTRRNLLRTAPVVALGGALAAMATTPAAAATGGPLLLGKPNSADAVTELASPLTLDGALTVNAGMWADAITLTGINLNSGGDAAVTIQQQGGGLSLEVFGGISEEPHSGPAIVAIAHGNTAITAVADDTAVRFSTATDFGTAIAASSEGGSTITAVSTSTTATSDAVTIDYAGTSRALYAQSHNPTNINGTVTGVNEGHGTGVWGEQRNNTGAGIGVVGVGGSQGRGAQFTGGAAQARLVPGTAAHPPDDGKDGRRVRRQRRTAVVLHQGICRLDCCRLEAARMTRRFTDDLQPAGHSPGTARVRSCGRCGGNECDRQGSGDDMDADETVRYEALQAQLDVMRDELGRLREQLAGSAAAPGSASTVLTRRNLLRAAPVVAVGGALAAIATSPAAAAAGNPVVLGQANTSGSATTSITGGQKSPDAPAVSYSGGVVGDWLLLGNPLGGNQVQSATTDGDPLLRTFSLDCYAAEFVAGAGNALASGGHDLLHVQAFGPGNGITIEATDHTYPNLDGTFTTETSDGIDITGGEGTGVDVTISSGVAFAATAQDGQAFVASGTSATTAKDAVTIDYAGTSRALYAQSHNPTNINGTVTGVNEGHGTGVWGEQRNNTGSGFGLVGVGGAQGRGARLSGGAAAAQMVPSTAAGHPTTGKAGDFFVDASVRLWFCTKASSGSVAAAWRQLA